MYAPSKVAKMKIVGENALSKPLRLAFL